jgi:hypothetical protein
MGGLQLIPAWVCMPLWVMGPSTHTHSQSHNHSHSTTHTHKPPTACLGLQHHSDHKWLVEYVAAGWQRQVRRSKWVCSRGSVSVKRKPSSEASMGAEVSSMQQHHPRSQATVINYGKCCAQGSPSLAPSCLRLCPLLPSVGGFGCPVKCPRERERELF